MVAAFSAYFGLVYSPGRVFESFEYSPEFFHLDLECLVFPFELVSLCSHLLQLHMENGVFFLLLQFLFPQECYFFLQLFDRNLPQHVEFLQILS